MKIEKLITWENFLLRKFELHIYLNPANLSEVITPNCGPKKEETMKTKEFQAKDANVQKNILNTITLYMTGN